ncbi:hypothetical protein ABEB36_010349 [Hypothenemus hampei]|uniref:Chloride channel CLIC-like protein 1 n=1 Tax=Hypothenemus hampei TaxID=57062 RepID=A0ABD1EJK8_HYPHA
MNTNAKAKYVKSTLKKSSSTSILNEPLDMGNHICNIHLKRIISLLVNQLSIDKSDEKKYQGYLKLKLVKDSWTFLQDFVHDNDFSAEKLRMLDSVLSEALKKSLTDNISDYSHSLIMKLSSLILNIRILWIPGALFLAYAVTQLFKNNFSFSYILKYLFVLVLISDFGFRYNNLVEVAKEHNENVIYSKKCDPTQMSWLEWFKSSWDNKDCERRMITPLDAFLDQIKQLIIVPLPALGEAMGGFASNMYSKLPWFVGTIMFPIMLLFCLYFGTFLITIYTRQSIELNLFHLLKLKFSGNSTEENRPTHRQLANEAHREIVQNVNITVRANKELPEKSSNKEIACGHVVDEKGDSTVECLESTQGTTQGTSSEIETIETRNEENDSYQGEIRKRVNLVCN